MVCNPPDRVATEDEWFDSIQSDLPSDDDGDFPFKEGNYDKNKASHKCVSPMFNMLNLVITW